MMKSSDWKKLGTLRSVKSHQLFVIDTDKMRKLLAMHHEEARKELPTMVFLHGYPTSTFDYYKVFEELSIHYRLVMHDHLGFGFSDKSTDYSYSLIEQADMALALWKDLGLKKVILFAHDYGTSVATEILARDNANELDIEIEKLILCNGSMHIELSQLRTIQKLLKHPFWGKYVAKLTNYPIFKKNLRNVYYDKSKVTDEELKSMWYQIEYNNGRKVIHKLSQYINERYEYWDRWIGALKVTQIPTKIVWAQNDPVAVAAIAELLTTEIPNNELFWVEHTGHFPMLENPEEWIKHIVP
ncbi:alpha/beta fold hydrolase [Pseudotenacibaculum haliotis]|uniref:Alpha/beta fold hydrolase n=1 Tax=Pseudotenacibaculum haliotis TaxID=1862138 RepID=A0ABW5LUX3_9FLAO